MSGIASGRPGIRRIRRPEPASKPPGMSTICVDMRPLDQARERHIFAERHQMLLVVALRREPVAADNFDGIEVARRSVSVLAPRRAGDQRRAILKEVDDLGKRQRVAPQNERKSRLGPDQVRNVANSGSIGRGRALRKVEIAAHDRLAVLRAESVVVLARRWAG